MGFVPKMLVESFEESQKAFKYGDLAINKTPWELYVECLKRIEIKEKWVLL